MKISEYVLRIIEFESALAVFFGCMKSELGLIFLRALPFCADMKQLAARQALLNDWINFCSREHVVWNNKVVPVGESLAGAKKNGLLSGEELLKVREFLSLEAQLRTQLNADTKDYPTFSALTRRMREFSFEIEQLKVIEDSGRLADGASPKLRDLREQIEELRRTARRVAQRILDDDKITNMLQERTTVFRDGRFLLLVRQESINRFPGNFVDRSSSGNSVYMEPHQMTALNNKVSMLTRDERDEEHKILNALTKLILSREGAIGEAENALGEIDLLCAADEAARKFRWKIPALTQEISFKLIDARHPLLKERAVPLDISCGGAKSFKQLIVTGSNTGGKTVVLKTVAVALALAYLGLPIPAGEGSLVGDIDEIFADIGDEQSIEQNLSTFSSHLKNIISIVKTARKNSLVLLDELGAGTDPQEGAALGVAILDTLRTENMSLVIANTHHNPIKQYALTTDRVETASMEFDIKTLSPTYRLLMGVPGRSNALAIAKTYGMPQKVIERAQKSLDERETTGEDVIARINERARFLEISERQAKQNERSLEKMRREYQDRLSELERRRDEILSSADENAVKIISEAEEKSRSMIRGVDGALKSAAHREIHTKHDDVEKLRRLIENRSKKRRAKIIESEHKKIEPAMLEVGATVQVIDSGLVGIIQEIKNGRARLIAGAMKLDVPIEKLAPTLKKAKIATPVIDTSAPLRYDTVPSSIMVRGLDAGEAMPLVAQYLDRAMRAGHTSVVVIHGRGQGILRREVHALCASLKYVSQYRLGDAGEGGYGVTVVSFVR